MLLLIARHGEREDFKEDGAWSHAWWAANAHGRHWDPPLTLTGQEQAGDLGTLVAAKLAQHGVAEVPLTVLSSPFLRCFETAAAVAARAPAHTRLAVDGSLCEHLRADWFDAATAARPDFLLTAEALSASGGGCCAVASEPALAVATYPEGDAELCARARGIAQSLVRLSCASDAPAAVLLVTHGGVLGAIVAALAAACDAPPPAIPHQGYAALNVFAVVPRAQQGAPASDLVVHSMAELPLRLTAHQRWFDGQEGVWRRVLLPIIQARKAEAGGAVSVLELGSWEGASAAWLLTHCCDASASARVTCVDHFDKLRTSAGVQRADKFSHNTRLTGLWPRVELVVDFTVAALSRLLAERREWDLVYVDASHEAADTLLDAMLAWKGLRRGGVLVFDDYMWPEHPDDSPLHPKPGIDAFMRVHAHEFDVVHAGYQVMLRKRTPPRFNF